MPPERDLAPCGMPPQIQFQIQIPPPPIPPSHQSFQMPQSRPAPYMLPYGVPPQMLPQRQFTSYDLPDCVLPPIPPGVQLPRVPLELHPPERQPGGRQPKSRELTHDERRDIKILRSVGWKLRQIQLYTGFSIRQIHYATHSPTTPAKRSGRPPVLTQAQIEELIRFVTMSAHNRQLSFEQLSKELDLGVGKKCLRATLNKQGYHRRLAMQKPPVTESDRLKRLQWAVEHVNWTMEQWYSILWTHETWMTSGRCTQTWVTLKAGEEWDSTCIVEGPPPKKVGFMFWGCFHGHKKGPSVFWKREWGSVDAKKYSTLTVPRISEYIEAMKKEGIELQLMQDGAPGYSAETQVELAEKGITVVFWPEFSPDLNPIESVWPVMNHYIQERFAEVMTYERLRVAVKEAWENVGEDKLKELIEGMPARCQAVIDANGLFTKY